MAKKSLLLVIPNPDRSGRYCVYDPATDSYLEGGVNIPLQRAKDLADSRQPGDWQDTARSHGWLPPKEVETLLRTEKEAHAKGQKETAGIEEPKEGSSDETGPNETSNEAGSTGSEPPAGNGVSGFTDL